MEARIIRATLLVAVLLVSMGARYRSVNFVVDAPQPAFAREVCQAAEKYRYDLAIEWLGKPMPNWSRPCVMTVHVGPRLGNGGATTFVFDRGEVFGWRMTIQGSRQRLLDSVLPHEITHTIFASHFRRPLPRWADEGGATSVEHASERNNYNKMLYQFLQTGRGIAFNQMFRMKQYPRDAMPLYAQGHSLATFLIQTGGRRKYVEFVGDGMETGDWSAAIHHHYGFQDAGMLQNRWLAWVRQGSPRIKPQHPAASPSAEMLASAEEPSGKTASAGPLPYAPGSVVNATAVTPPRRELAARDGAPEPKPMPSDGWRAVGGQSGAPTVADAVASAPSPPRVTPPNDLEPIRAQAARPQPMEPSRQIILEWNAR